MKRTQIFGSVQPLAQAGVKTASSAPSPQQAAGEHEPARRGQGFASFASASPAELAGSMRTAEPGGLALPPEEPSGAPRAPAPFALELEEPAGEARFEVGAIGDGRRLRDAVLLLGVALLLGLGALALYRAWQHRKAAVPVAALAQYDEALALLQRDDARARERATKSLSALVLERPQFTEARAGHAMALLLELDDQRATLESLEEELRELRGQLAQGGSPGVEPPGRPQVEFRVESLQAERSALQASIARLQHDANQALHALPEPALDAAHGGAAVRRVQALYAAVEGSSQARVLVTEYRKENPADPWGTALLAEAALGAPGGDGDLRAEMQALVDLARQEPSFIRAYLLAARLALRAQTHPLARSELEEALTLDPSHELARRLLDWERRRPGAGGP